MRKIIIISFLLFSINLNATVWYVATTGNDSNAGTIGSPWLTWQKAFTSTSVNAGDTVYFRGGVYPHTYMDTYGFGYEITRSGTLGDTVCYFNYPGEEPILDCGNMHTSGSMTHWHPISYGPVTYCHFRGLTIRNVWQTDGDDEIVVWEMSGSHIVLENCKIYNAHGIGFKIIDSSHDIYFINCDVWNMCDSLANFNPGGIGTGFSVMNWDGVPSDSVRFTNCRAWMCSDQGFAAASNGCVIYENCWAFRNGYLQSSMPSAPSGFKEGWIEDIYYGQTQKIYKNCVAAYNRGQGWTTNDQDYHSAKMLHYNCTSYHNGYYGFRVEDPPLETDAHQRERIYINNIAYDNENGPFCLGWPDAKATNYYNSWDSSPSIVLSPTDFISLDSTGITAARQADGSLPDNDCYKYFLHLSSESKAKNVGTDIGLPYNGTAPDLGAFENPNESPVAVGEIISNSKLVVYPNPVLGILNIDLKEIYSEVSIQVFSITGREVINQTYKQKQIIELVLDRLSNGLYLVNIKLNGENTSIKIVKIRSF